MDWKLFVVFISLCLTFLFSAAETALTSLGRLELQTLLAREDEAAKLIKKWVRSPSRMLITVLVGNNIVTVLASSLFALWANEHYSSVTQSFLMVGFTFALIFGSEIIPKLLARQFSVQTAPHAMQFLNVVGAVLSPLIYVMDKMATGLVFMSGKSGRAHRSIIGEEELSQTIEIATQEGGIDRETGEVMTNLMDFPDRIARDVMTPRSKIQVLSVAWSFDEVLKFIAQDGHSRYPVMGSSLDEIVGVLLVKDLISHAQRGMGAVWTRAIRRPYFVSEIAQLGKILRDMRRWGTHLALVRNETGVLTGLLTMEDLIEEIVGDIRDEHDEPPEVQSERQMGGPRLVNGDIPIIDFNDLYSAPLPLDIGYSTLNGYLLSKTGGEIPPVGTLIFGDDLTFRVHSVSDAGIATIQVIHVGHASSQ